MTVVLPARELRAWVAHAKYGDRVQYIHDAVTLMDATGDAVVTRNAAYVMYEMGMIALIQARNELGTFDYIAERVSPNTVDILDRVSRSMPVRLK